MTTIDFSPIYRSSIGFDRLATLLNTALNTETATNSYPPYNIEAHEDSKYAITLAVAGFEQDELNLQTEKGILTVSGKKADNKAEHKYLYQGIAGRSFERKFNLADYVEVTGAELKNGLLTIHLVKEVPEAMKPKSIAINQPDNVIEHQNNKRKAA